MPDTLLSCSRRTLATSPSPRTRRSVLTRQAAAVALVATLAACGTTQPDSTSAASGSTTAASATTTPGSASDTPAPSADRVGPLTITDGWAKATDEMMSAVFGTLVNNSDQALHLTGGSCDVASALEMHEFVKNDAGAMVMQRKPDGFTIAPGASLTLEPGGNHLMLLGLRAPLRNGDPLTVTVETNLGAVPLTVMIRSFDGANESYDPSMGESSMSHSS